MVVQTAALPLFEALRLAQDEVGFHGEPGLRQVQCVLIVGRHNMTNSHGTSVCTGCQRTEGGGAKLNLPPDLEKGTRETEVRSDDEADRNAQDFQRCFPVFCARTPPLTSLGVFVKDLGRVGTVSQIPWRKRLRLNVSFFKILLFVPSESAIAFTDDKTDL